MKNLKPSKPAIIGVDFLIFLLCLTGLYQIANRSDIPFKVSSNDKMIVEDVYDSNSVIAIGDTIRSIDGYKLAAGDELEIYLDRKKIGDTINIHYERNGEILRSELKLVKYYSLFYVILAGSIGFLFLLFALFVLLRRFNETEAHVFHWLCIGVGMILMLTWGACSLDSDFISALTRIGFHLSYTFVPALLIHFVKIFPEKADKSQRYLLTSFYIFAGLLTILMSVQFILYQKDFNIDSVRRYLLLFNIARIFIAFSVIYAIITLIRAYRQTSTVLIFSKHLPNESVKKKLKWVIYGLFVGPLLFIFLWVIPQLVMNKYLVPEELILIAILSVPICFSVSIIKYHLFDIDIIINRSVVYALLGALLLLTYTTLVIFIPDIVENQTALVISAISIGLLFHPTKLKVQKFVDRKFFKIQYDFRIAIRDLFKAIKNVTNIEALSRKIISGIDNLMPVQLMGLFLLKLPENRVQLIAHKNFDLLVGRSVKFQPGNLKTDLSLPVAVEGKVEQGADIEIADSRVFKRWKIDIVFPLKSSTGEVLGFLVLGEKMSGNTFNVEDVDLLNTLSVRIASSIERIKLQEEVIREHLEAERLEELNRMKTFFVSSVSHDLKTPITSIKMFSNFVQNSENVADKEKEYLNIIEGESDRLTRLIDNVLNYSMIEKGIRNYEMEQVSLNHIVDEVLSVMNYQLKLENYKVGIKKPDTELFIYADKDAVKEAIINLISNSIKYSGENKEISIRIYCLSDKAILEVSDKGIGMSDEEKINIFNEFYQIGEKGRKFKGGVGLGLTIVKHVMDAHNGKIELESEQGKGTTFKLIFQSKNEN